MPPGHFANLSSAPRERLRTPAIARTTGERLVDHIALGRFCLHAPKDCYFLPFVRQAARGGWARSRLPMRVDAALSAFS
jgi:hypothetical protein